MLLSAPELDVSDSEARIKALLASAQDLDDDVHDVCWHFGDILMRVLRSSPGDREWRYWSLDDLVPKSVSRSGNVMTLSGLAWWLSGGDGCQRFRLDVALDKEAAFQSACVTLAENRRLREFRSAPPVLPWGVILASNRDRDGVERQVARLQNRHAAVLRGEPVSYTRGRRPGMPRALHYAQVGRASRARRWWRKRCRLD